MTIKLNENDVYVNKISVSLFSSQKPLSKGFELDDSGALQKINGGSMTRGVCERLDFNDISELAELLPTLRPINGMAYGVSEHQRADVVTKKKLAKIKHNGGPPVIARSRDNFKWSAGRALWMDDYDPEKGTIPMTGDEFLQAVYSVCPEIKNAPHLLVPSASTFIYNGPEELKGSGGWRLLIVVAHGTDIPRAGDVFFKRGWLAGFGFIFITKSGAMLPRCKLVDAAVWRPEHLDFNGPPTCTPPLEQRRPAPKVFNADAEPLDTAQVLKSLTFAEEGEFMKLKGAAIREARPEANRIKDQWIDDRVSAHLAKEKPAEEDVEERARQLREIYTMAIKKQVLMGDFVLIHTSGQEVAVGGTLDDPDKWHGERFHDPLEPDYGGNDNRIAVLNLRASGRPYLYSHAHGGQRFTLVRARETIRMVDGERVSIVHSCLEGMRVCGTHYTRGNEIVLTTKDGETIPRNRDGILFDLDSLFRFERYNKTQELWLPTDCKQPIAAGILAAQGSWGLEELTGISTAPIIDPVSGRLIDSDGYDSQTGVMLILNDNSQWPGIPDEPSPLDIELALDVIWAPFKKFPFDGPISRGVFLTGFLTACVRPLLPTAPGICLDAPIAGSGKSLLAKCLSIIAGDAPAMLPDAGDPEEIRKRLLALLRQNKRVMVLDNVTGVLDSSALCAMVTAETYSDRVLGVTEVIEVPTRTLLLITGNNVTVAGDLCRRVLTARIDPEIEMPWKRSFDLDPAEYCWDHRIEMVAAGLTIIRAGIQNGPAMPDRTASFELWSDTVRRAVCLVAQCGPLDVTDPVESIDTAYSMDPETGKLGALMAAWWDIWVDEPVKTATLIKFAQNEDEGEIEYPELNEAVDAICGNGKTLNPRRLGIWIGKNKARLVDGFRIVEAERKTKSHKSKEWRTVLQF